jgi:hypothetical protein
LGQDYGSLNLLDRNKNNWRVVAMNIPVGHCAMPTSNGS